MISLVEYGVLHGERCAVHSSKKGINGEDASHTKENFEGEHVSASYAFTGPRAMVVQFFDAVVAIVTVFCHYVLPLNYFASFAVIINAEAR